eukprot:Em0020g943a
MTELVSDSSEDDFPVVTLKPAWCGQSQDEPRGRRRTVSRQTDEIVLSSDSESGHTKLRPKADHAAVGASVPSPGVCQTADSTVAEPAGCHATYDMYTVSRSLAPQFEERGEMKRRQDKKNDERATGTEKRTEKKRKGEVQKAVRKAELDGKKEHRPGERVKQMTVIMDTTLSEHVSFMAAFTPRMQEMGVGYCLCAHPEPGSVHWVRKVTERAVDDHAQVTHTVIESKERSLLVVLEAERFANLVHNHKRVITGHGVATGAITLVQHVENLQRSNPGVSVTLVVEGMELYFRGKKRQRNKQFRCAVNGTKAAGPQLCDQAVEVTWVECEEALVDLQLTSRTVVRMCEGGSQLADLVITFTKALAETPYKKEDLFSFHSQTACVTSKKVHLEGGGKVSAIWQHQLMQMNGVSKEIAAAIAAVHPSPHHLLTAYESCSSQDAELLLQDCAGQARHRSSRLD